jgi:hypothetical protein
LVVNELKDMPFRQAVVGKLARPVGLELLGFLVQAPAALDNGLAIDLLRPYLGCLDQQLLECPFIEVIRRARDQAVHFSEAHGEVCIAHQSQPANGLFIVGQADSRVNPPPQGFRPDIAILGS